MYYMAIEISAILKKRLVVHLISESDRRIREKSFISNLPRDVGTIPVIVMFARI